MQAHYNDSLAPNRNWTVQGKQYDDWNISQPCRQVFNGFISTEMAYIVNTHCAGLIIAWIFGADKVIVYVIRYPISEKKKMLERLDCMKKRYSDVKKKCLEFVASCSDWITRRLSCITQRFDLSARLSDYITSRFRDAKVRLDSIKERLDCTARLTSYSLFHGCPPLSQKKFYLRIESFFDVNALT